VHPLARLLGVGRQSDATVRRTPSASGVIV
jgi:hypothetical protein